jgi:hypothetical protein
MGRNKHAKIRRLINFLQGLTPGIICEAVHASDLDGAGMRLHVHSGNHAAESFVSFISLFDRVAAPYTPACVACHSARARSAKPSAVAPSGNARRGTI